MGEGKTFTISELAREFDVTTRTIRFYEEKGLLHPSRQGQHRIFGKQDRATLELILRGKRAGLSLEESREIIDMYDPAGDNYEQYQFLLNKVNQRQAQLEAQLEDIKALLNGLEEVRKRCNRALKKIARPRAAG
ncbi:transcriptional regulator, MerR family [Luminiphilus syltensis NOR5-1B]|uniref:Transcriptional regulator, MerR family n=1 Tax=Luminiphilus syltensis NOR5-1B TaxID=565045 RepID=B8KXY7_9GAMM|nr:MerR family DNA-binding transcriptional regulator [Luminiphilus syltensis]EED36058.1 transcriptional regulator, MerR family [Luminiphilus syltensis NOR5-1B]